MGAGLPAMAALQNSPWLIRGNSNFLHLSRTQHSNCYANDTVLNNNYLKTHY